MNELKELGAEQVLAAGTGNVYALPDNYFRDLPGMVLAHVHLQSIPKLNTYTVPAGYFESFPGVMVSKLATLLPGLPDSATVTYTVPENYFDTFAGNVLAKIRAASPASEVMAELETISPLVSSIPRANVFTVPESYFATLEVKPQQTPARVVPMNSPRRWMHYAAAACVAVFLLGGGYMFINRPVPAATASTTANVEEQISGLSDEEISSYLRANSNMAVFTNTAVDENQAKNLEVQNLLEVISDEEIQQYLEQDPESTDAGEGI